MNRRARGRGRLVVVVAAVLLIIGCIPAWWAVGGTVTPALSGNGFDGIGIAVFFAALALLAVVVLPYATREGDSRLDSPWSYVLLAATAAAAFGWRVVQIRDFDGSGCPIGPRACGSPAPRCWYTSGELPKSLASAQRSGDRRFYSAKNSRTSCWK